MLRKIDTYRASLQCEDAFSHVGLRVFARVKEAPDAIDLAIDTGRRVVVRCVDQIVRADYTALKTMLAEGDFDHAFIVYTAEDQPHLSGEIESYPLSRIDELAASLARESAP